MRPALVTMRSQGSARCGFALVGAAMVIFGRSTALSIRVTRWGNDPTGGIWHCTNPICCYAGLFFGEEF